MPNYSQQTETNLDFLAGGGPVSVRSTSTTTLVAADTVDTAADGAEVGGTLDALSAAATQQERLPIVLIMPPHPGHMPVTFITMAMRHTERTVEMTSECR